MGRWEEGKGGSRSSLFPLSIVPRALSFSFSPASPQQKQASGEERALSPKILVLRYCEPVGVWWEDRILYPMNDKSKFRVVISKQIFFLKS